MTSASSASNIYCPVCNNDGQHVTFNERQFLHEHLENLHSYFKCSLCPVVVYVSPESLEQHNSRFHQGQLVVEVEQLVDQKQAAKRKNVEPYPSPKHVKYTKEVDSEFTAELENELSEPYLDTSTLTEGEYCQPSRYSRDPLKGFFLQTILECKECPQRPTKKFATHNAWQLHIKTFHKHIKTITDYKAVHGDPDLVKFRHQCRMCLQELVLNLSVVKRHLLHQHQTNLATYLAKFREELVQERLGRPIVPPSHTLEGWWEGCMYTCRICQQTFSAQLAFENHLSSSHSITGQREIETRYTGVWGRLSSLTRAHQCYVCRKVIRHEYKVIFQHLSKHKLDLETYAARFRDKLVKELTDKEMTYIVDRETDSRSIISLEEYLANNKTSIDTPDPMEGWFDCSEHKCVLCARTFWSNLRFHWHIKREHGIGSTKEYRRLHGDPEVTLRQHKCQICNNLIKWEASRIRDHLKFHKDPKDKLSLKEYGQRFRDYILKEVIKIKNASQDNPESNIPTCDEEPAASSVAKSGHVIKGDTPDCGYTVKEWKELFSKKVSPDDKVECNICRRNMNRHSFTRHQERAHKGILNMRDLNRLKRKQLQLAQSGVIKSLGELLRWAGGVAVVKGKGDSKEEVDLEKEDQESRLNLYKAGLTLEQIESKVELINSGLTITKAIKEKLDANVPEGSEFVEIDNEVEEDAAYPTYVVDQDTGEILIVEQITGFEEEQDRTSSDPCSKSPDDILPDVFGKNLDMEVSDTAILEEDMSNNAKKEIFVTGTDLEYCMLADVDHMPNGWHEETDKKGLVVTEVQSEEDDDHFEAETGPLDGQIMQIDLPDRKFGDDHDNFGDDIMVNFEQVRIIRLEQEEQQLDEEQELEEEMLQSELETEYLLEDGKLRKINNLDRSGMMCSQDKINPDEQTKDDDNKFEKLESLVMLAEDGSARIVVGGKEDTEDFIFGEHYVLGSKDVHYVLGHEEEGHFVLQTPEDESFDAEEKLDIAVEVEDIDRTLVNQKNNKSVLDHGKDPAVRKQESHHELGIAGDHFVLQQKEVQNQGGNSVKQENKEKKRRNLLLKRRAGGLEPVVDSVVGHQEVPIREGEVIHQSELLDGDLVTGYLVLDDGNQVVLEEEQKFVHEEGVQAMVFTEEDQITYKEGEQILLNTNDHKICDGDQLVYQCSQGHTLEVTKQMEGVQELTETNQYIHVVEDPLERAGTATSHPQAFTRLTGGWQEQGGSEQEYDRKVVSKPRVETNGRVSQGTVVCQWTKMPGDRVRVAHSKVIRPRVGQHEQEQEEMLSMNSLQTSSAYTDTIPLPGDISAPLLYSSLGCVWRDVGSQVTPHRVNGLPTDREEEQRQVDRIKQFLGCGGVLDRSCPGCGKVMSRQRNLVTHLQVLHGVEVKGPEGEEHIARYSKENQRVQCDICSKTISRKSIRRHVNLCHPSAVAVSQFTRDKSKTH
eukprot:GFUD01033005.1.p1 GENE.GFUD01033005.1~~GFUD01033005.1.p1  ORF type:complete len:1447 (+),score=438.90 GFUD01033005.1:81-4421(+)